MNFKEWCLKTGLIKYFGTVLVCLLLIFFLIELADLSDGEYVFEGNELIEGPTSISVKGAGTISLYEPNEEEVTWVDIAIDGYRIGYRQGVADSENADFDLLNLRLEKFRKALKEK